MAAALNGRPGGHGELFRSRSRASLRDALMAESKRNIFKVTARQICVPATADFLGDFARFLALYWRSQ
jgi:hypothetical protein